MGRHVKRAARAALLFSLVTLGIGFAGCRRPAPPRQFALEGQILAVHPERQELTIKHGDIEGLMPGMTMSFPVASAVMLKERTPGELVRATLELGDSGAKLVSITHTGTAPLPSASEVALAGGVLAVGDSVPDAAFVDQRDTRRSFSEWKGTPTLVTFIYTSCPLPNFCPLMSQNLATIQRAIAEDPALAGNVKLVSITFDPERDTPAVLAKHAAKLKVDPAVWTMLTGDKKTIEKFAAKFGVGLIRSAETPDEITHNLRTTLVGADGRVVQIYSGNEWTPSAVIADLRKIVRPS
jgi:protein SCO1/2